MISLYVWECITSICGSTRMFVWNKVRAWVLCPCCSDTRLSWNLGIRCDHMDDQMAPAQTLKVQMNLPSFQEAVTGIYCHIPRRYSLYLLSSPLQLVPSWACCFGRFWKLKEEELGYWEYAFENNIWYLSFLLSLFPVHQEVNWNVYLIILYQ